MEMDSVEFVNLFDSCWFSLEIFKKQSQRSDLEENPSDLPKTSSLQKVRVRSNSIIEELSSMESFTSDNFLSPNSVLVTPPLQTILSGKEATQEEPAPIEYEEEQPRKIKPTRRTEKGRSKSLSDLEFQELKGFIDLGFVFSEEDTNSSLIEIVPGLNRLGKKDNGENDQERTLDEGSSVSRPYLSEAWEVLERRRRKRENPSMNWRIPVLSNEIDMKQSLKRWAHTVAFTVG